MTSPDPTSGLVVDGDCADRLLDLAREGAPAEVCGVLGGAGGRVTRVEPVPNVAATSETRYELDPGATVDAVERVEADGEHLGFYHSHPRGPPAPSATDRAEATWSGFVYCIVSLPDSSIRAWRWTGERFEQLSVERRS